MIPAQPIPKIFSLSEEMKQELKSKIEQDNSTKAPFWYDKFEIESQKNWDKFYRHNSTNFFHDRNYIEYEFPELSNNVDEKKIYCELGCGVGNTIFPLLKKFPNMIFYGFDISKEAISLFQKNELYSEDRIPLLSVCDLVKDPIPSFPSPDFSSLVFVLSALSPENHNMVIKKISEFLKKDSYLYFRDYAKFDLAQLRFAEKKEARLKENFYVKTDRTRVYYFEKEELETLFKDNGFEVTQCEYCMKVIENRKTEEKMHRIWIQGRFKKL